MTRDQKIKAFVVGFFTTGNHPEHYDEIMQAQDFEEITHIMVCEQFENEPLNVIQSLMIDLYDSTWALLRSRP